jgi:hypothetical protein
MLDARIYRTGLVPVVLAVIVLAFSLSDQQGPVTTTLTPQAFNAASAYQGMKALAKDYPHRVPGSDGDARVAREAVVPALQNAGFRVFTDTFRGRTADGTTTLQNVIGVRAGQQNGSIVVVADRSALGAPAAAGLSGTAVLLQLASVLSGETLQHTIVLASTSGAAGDAGALRLAQTIQRPVDAVIVLGDLAGRTVRQPVVVPWSDGQSVAPPVLRNTVAAVLQSQAGLGAGSAGLIGQLAHLTLPMAATEQGPFGSRGLPAVLLSVSGERVPAANELTSQSQIGAMGRTVLQAVVALDGAQSVPAPSTYLGFSGKTVPAWAIRLLVLALILPVLMATIDGLARARRRGHSILRWVAWVLAAGFPFAVAAALMVLARVVGVIGAAPPAPVPAGAIPLRGAGIALLAVLGITIVGGLVWLRPAVIRLIGLGSAADRRQPYGAGTAASLLLVLCVISLLVWLANPFAAILLVPALHLWLWIIVPDVRVPAPVAALLLAAGLALPALIAIEYASTLGLGPVQALWSWVLLLAGGGVGVIAALEWGILAGCAISVFAIALRSAREPRPEPIPVTIRGPVGYAGPGSLGGTESALRR